MEDAAALVNALKRKLDTSEQRLSTGDFQKIFADTQRSQEDRTKHLLVHSSKMQSFDAMESIFAPVAVKFVIPNLTDDAALSIVGANTVQGQHIESLPIPLRDRYIPYNDELPAKPLKNMSIFKFFAAAIYLLLLYMVYPVPSTFESRGDPRSIAYLGQSFDTLIVDSTVTLKNTSGRLLHSTSTVIPLIPTIILWNLEGHRRGNSRSLGSWYVDGFLPSIANIGLAFNVLGLLR